MVKKITIAECESFFLDQDNKELYPRIWNMLKTYYDLEYQDKSQYMIEPKEEGDHSIFELRCFKNE